LFAALNTATGEVLGKTAAHHTSIRFVAFLTEVVSAQRFQIEAIRPSLRKLTSV